MLARHLAGQSASARRLGELLSESHVGDGNVLEGDIELLGALKEVAADAVGQASR